MRVAVATGAMEATTADCVEGAVSEDPPPPHDMENRKALLTSRAGVQERPIMLLVMC